MPSFRGRLQHAVKSAAVAADAIRRPHDGIVVLIYHRVGGDSGLEVDLTEALFDEQLATLAASERVVSLGRALDLLTDPEPDPDVRRPVVVTFDDGTADFVDRALPIIHRHRIPVTLYAATEFIDEGRPFPDEGRPASWAGLAEACSTGLVEIGSHTHRHVLLDRLPDDQVADELDRSIDLIGTHLGTAPLDFAYPKAVSGSPAAREAVRDRFRSAAVAGTRPNRFGRTDVYDLARSPVQQSDGMRWFGHKVDGGMALEDTMRQLLNRRRYATATT